MDQSGDLFAQDTNLTPEERTVLARMSARRRGTAYEVLGLPATADATVIRRAYYEALRVAHPDMYWDRDLGPLADEIAKIHRALVAAYEVLSDSERRRAYDAVLIGRLLQGGEPDTVVVDRPWRRDTPPERPPSDPPRQWTPEAPMRAIPPSDPPAFGAWDPTENDIPGPPILPRGTGPSRTPLPFQNPVIPKPLVRTPGSTPPGAMRLPPTSTDPVAEETRRNLAAQRFSRVMGPRDGPTPPSARVPAQEPPPSERPVTSRPPSQPAPPWEGSAPPAMRASTREALQRLLVERHVRDRETRRQELDAAITRAALASDDQEVLNLLKAALLLSPDDALLQARVERAQDVVSSANVERLSQLARAAERSARWEAAAVQWQRAATLHPDDPQLALHAAEALLEGKADYGRAAELARKATQLDPTLLAAHLCLARIFLAAGRTASARGAILVAQRLAPQSPDVIALVKSLKR